MGEYLGLFYMALGIIWMGKGVLNLMGKGIPEDVKKKLSEERLQIFIRKTGVSCLVFGLPMVGLGLVRMGIVPMSIPGIVVIVVLLAVGLVLSVKAVKYGES